MDIPFIDAASSDFWKTALFSRADCDAKSITDNGLYDANLYLNSYFFGMFFLIFAFIINLGNIFLSKERFQNSFNNNRIMHKSYWSGFLTSFSFSVLIYFSLSNWKFTGEDGYNCSWFSSVQDPSQFTEQFWTALMLIGLLQSALLLSLVIMSNHLLRMVYSKYERAG